MARIIFIALMVYFTSEVTAQIVVYNQRYQVANMPQPKSFTFYNAFATPSEKITAPTTEYSYQRRYHRFTGNPIPVANREGLNVSIGFGYATDQLAINSTSVNNSNHAIWTQLYTAGSIGEHYYWRGAYAIGSYSNKVNFKNSSTYKHTVFAEFGKKWSSKLATSVGVLALSNYNDPQFIPTAHISYATGSWIIDAILPNDISIRYMLNEKLHFLVTNTLVRRSYYNFNTGFSNKFSINKVGIQAEFKIIGVLWAELAITKPYGLKSEVQDENNYTEIGEITQNLSLNGGLFIRFQEKY